MKIHAEHIVIAIAAFLYILGMAKMAKELVTVKSKEERSQRLIIPMMVSMTILFAVITVKALATIKYLF